MNFFTTKRLVTSAFVLLVVLNALLLSMLWWQNAHRPQLFNGGHGFNHEYMFARQLDLSEAQTLHFEKLREEHFLKVKPEMEAITLLKKQLVEESLNDNPDTKKIDAFVTGIGSHQAALERELVQHFHQMAKLCTPEQRVKLKAVLENMATRRMHGGKGRWGDTPQTGRVDCNRPPR